MGWGRYLASVELLLLSFAQGLCSDLCIAGALELDLIGHVTIRTTAFHDSSHAVISATSRTRHNFLCLCPCALVNLCWLRWIVQHFLVEPVTLLLTPRFSSRYHRLKADKLAILGLIILAR